MKQTVNNVLLNQQYIFEHATFTQNVLDGKIYFFYLNFLVLHIKLELQNKVEPNKTALFTNTIILPSKFYSKQLKLKRK